MLNISVERDPNQPSFEHNTSINHESLVVDASGRSWWVDPIMKKITKVAEQPRLTPGDCYNHESMITDLDGESWWMDPVNRMISKVTVEAGN